MTPEFSGKCAHPVIIPAEPSRLAPSVRASMHSTHLRRTLILLGLLVAFPGTVPAQGGDADIPLEHRIAPGKGEPEVTIIQRPHMTITEYRSGGRVYMVEVDPDMGPPYYLIDRNGDGEWDDRMGPEVTVPQWTIFQW